MIRILYTFFIAILLHGSGWAERQAWEPMLMDWKFAPEQDFIERMDEVLHGERCVELPLYEGGSIVLQISRGDRRAESEAYTVDFCDAETGEEGIWSSFWIEGKVLGELVYLEKTSAVSGTEYLLAMDLFCYQMGVHSVRLMDAARVTEVVEGHEMDIFLRLHRILTSDDGLGWYESKGYAPVNVDLDGNLHRVISLK